MKMLHDGSSGTKGVKSTTCLQPGPNSARGYTLIELLVTVAIVGLLAAIAIPQYAEYVRKGRRADATATLQKLMNQQALYYANNGGTYTDIVANLGYTPSQANNNQMASDAGHYNVSLGQCDDGQTPLTECIQMVATAAGAEQQKDLECSQIGINSRGRLFATSKTDSNTTEDCWQ